MANQWQIDGTYIMACNCDYGCPCNFNAYPSTGNCEGVVAFAVDKGHYGDTDLAGAKAAMLVRWPGAIHEGNGKGVMYVADQTTSEQREAMASILSGDAGGPFGMIVKNTVSELDGPRYVPISVEVAGKDSRFVVGDAIRIVFDSIRNPVTGAESFPKVVLPQGIWSNELEEYTTSEFVAREGDLDVSHPGRTAQLATVHWTG